MTGFKGTKNDLHEDMLIHIINNTSNHGFKVGQKVSIVSITHWDGDLLDNDAIVCKDSEDEWCVPFRDFDLGEKHKLEAASPDLLEALESVCECLEITASRLGIHTLSSPIKNDAEDYGTHFALEQANKAIKKALEK